MKTLNLLIIYLNLSSNIPNLLPKWSFLVQKTLKYQMFVIGINNMELMIKIVVYVEAGIYILNTILYRKTK